MTALRLTAKAPTALLMPRPADRLRQLASAVERLATHGRQDPELIYIAKATIAAEMRQLASAMEHAS